MQTITLAQLLEAVGGELLGTYRKLDAPIFGVDTDSRNITRDSLFIPLCGERFDGHAYIDTALAAGAVGCLSEHSFEEYRPDRFYVKVSDTRLALRDLAVWYKQQFQIPFVAVTGSVGKTTAKDMISSVLRTKYKVLKTQGNYNNDIGLPLTLLCLDESIEICVLEMGMDKFGEIDYLAKAVKPDVGVITNIGDAHIEFFGSRENILKAKWELVPHIKEDGLLVLNGDDPLLRAMGERAVVQTVFAGEGETNAFRADIAQPSENHHLACRLQTPQFTSAVSIPALGAHMIYPALFAAAIGAHFGLTQQEIIRGIEQFVPTKMRMNILHRAQDVTILDDTYNANPQSMRAALRVLADSGGKQKIAVLGDMLELGPFAPALHKEVGEYAAKMGINVLITIGEMAQHIAAAAQKTGTLAVYPCSDKQRAQEILKELVTPDSRILLKASRGLKLEELTEFLLELTKE